MKFVKMAIGLCVLSALGLAYGVSMDTIDDMNEQKIYSFISLQVPDSTATMTILKKVPESKCERWRKDYFEASMGNCNGCTVLQNSCTPSIPNEYLPAFDNKKINAPYIYKPFKYPEVLILKGLPDGGFSRVCEVEKQQHAEIICISS